MQRSIVLLRGVNVGGHNRVPMAELREALTIAGFSDVATYIQSGNIGVSANRPVRAEEVSEILRASFGIDVPVVVVAPDEIEKIIASNPFADEGLDPSKVLVFFLGAAVKRGKPLDTERFHPDRFHIGDRAVYVHYPDGSARSKLTINRIERAVGATATARNMKTVPKLLEL